VNRSPYSVVFIFLLSICFLLSCGLEDIPYIDYIPDGTVTDNTSATVQLPSSSAEGYENPPVGYFTRFEIFYRIYISGDPLSGLIDTSALRRQINTSLDSDFQGLYNLTDKTSTSANPSNLDTTFNNRRFFKLALEEDNIDNVLGRNSLGRTLDIQFSPINGVSPVLLLNNVSYTLRRAVSGPSIIFKPVPDNLYFLNHADLFATENATNDINADVAVNTQAIPDYPRYTYVSMYIFAIGRDYLTTIYSQPTHLGIFRLAEAN
jgi:hypothetical protein